MGYCFFVSVQVLPSALSVGGRNGAGIGTGGV